MRQPGKWRQTGERGQAGKTHVSFLATLKAPDRKENRVENIRKVSLTAADL
jgi:hypothetical protein